MDDYGAAALNGAAVVDEGNGTAEANATMLYEASAGNGSRLPQLDDQNRTEYLNISNELPIRYAVPMYGYAMPILLLVTIVANTLIVVVLSKKHMRTPTNAVLMAMALSDMFTLLFPAPWLFYMYTFGNHYRPLSPVGACFAWNVMNEIVPMLFHTASIWLTLALAVQRKLSDSEKGIHIRQVITMLAKIVRVEPTVASMIVETDRTPVSSCTCSVLEKVRSMSNLFNSSLRLSSPKSPRPSTSQRDEKMEMDEYIYVCHAPVARTWCTMPRVLKCIAWISFFAFLHQLTRFFEKKYDPVTITWGGESNITVCKVQFADWLNNHNVLNAYFIIYYSFRVIFVHVGPCISLVILNLLLFRAMRKAQLKRDKLFKENRKSECKKLRDSNCTTLMLIVVVTVFLLTEIPLAVVTVLHIISSGFTEILDYNIVNTLILFTNFFIIVSYPINFAIYCGMSRQFRETFKELFIRGTVPVTRRNGGSSKYSLVNGPRTCTNETVL